MGLADRSATSSRFLSLVVIPAKAGSQPFRILDRQSMLVIDVPLSGSPPARG